VDSDLINIKTYRHKNVVKQYSHENALQAAEIEALAGIADQIAGGQIMDIGVGGGRTTPGLIQISAHYTGIDYSKNMIEACKVRHPNLVFEVCDARNLEAFSADYYDLVMFSFNGIDYVNHADRLKILTGILRIMKPGGYLVFSSHNRDHGDFRRSLSKFPVFHRSWSPLRAAKHCVTFTTSLLRHARLSQNNIIENDYAIVNDCAHDYKLMTYYISIASQIRQLRLAGFDGHADAFSASGEKIEYDDSSAWIYYRTRKGSS
jgi:ubiquinone/menaquinone biosynthesis C-methylase UbiE